MKTYLSDNMVTDNSADITQFIHHKLNYCGYVGISDELDVEIVDAHFLLTTIEKKDILSVNEAGAVYHITFNVNAVFGFEQVWHNSDDTVQPDLCSPNETIYQYHSLTLALDVEISFNDKKGQNLKISVVMPDEIAVCYDEGEYVDWRNKNRYQFSKP